MIPLPLTGLGLSPGLQVGDLRPKPLSILHSPESRERHLPRDSRPAAAAALKAAPSQALGSVPASGADQAAHSPHSLPPLPAARTPSSLPPTPGAPPFSSGN